MITPFLLPKQALIRRPRNAPLPFIALAIGALVSYLPEFFSGDWRFNLGFLGWIVPLLGCGFTALLKHRLISFPLRLWLPWTIWVLLYLLFASAENALQRSVMLLTPLVVGTGFSTLHVDALLIKKFSTWISSFFWIVISAAGFSTGLLLIGQFNEVSTFAAGSITASLLAAWYAARYAGGDLRALGYWAMLVVIPVLANTRTGMVAVALTLPLTFAPLSIKKRWFMLAMLILVGLLVFQSERVQSKMFFSGQGTLLDAVSGVGNLFSSEMDTSNDFVTSGRKTVAIALISRLNENFWFGHGANTTEAITMSIADLAHPHNDWLRVLFEYGMLGVVLFTLTWLAQIRHARIRILQLRSSGAAKFIYAGLGSIIPMALFMSSDNILLYVAWFGNLQFAMLGLGYAAIRTTHRDGLQKSTP